MPSTTNNIESKHGHLNEMTPRNNTFLGSLHRLILSINTQLHQFNRNMIHNYRKVLNDTIKRSKDPHIAYKCNYYHSSLNSCECGENILYSKMFRVDVPCSHRYSLGATFPDLSEIDFNLDNQFNELIIDVIPEVIDDEVHEINLLKILAVKNIKRFSHSKDKEEIEKFFDDHFNSEFQEFALGYPIEFFDVISKGIKFFTDKKNKKVKKYKKTLIYF